MNNCDILKHFKNPFVDDGAKGYARFLGNALWGACVFVCLPLVPLALLGWAIGAAADRLERVGKELTDET